jgi:hypothetical protein
LGFSTVGTTMTAPPIEVRKEIDVVSVDPLFVERQRNRYASRAVASLVWLNGLAAIGLLIGLLATPPAEEVKRFADAMLVFGAGSVAGLVSAFFAYISRTFRLERPTLFGWRRPLRWLAILAALASAVCFLGALNMARVGAVLSLNLSRQRPVLQSLKQLHTGPEPRDSPP